MEKYSIEVPKWLHKQVEIWNNHSPIVKKMTIIAYVWFIIYVLTNIKIIIVR